MKLTNKLKTGVVVLASVGSLTSCLSPFGDAFVRDLGHTVVRQGAIRYAQNKVDEHYRSNREAQNNRRTQLPENVISSNGRYSPAPGYTWVNPGDNVDYRVRRKEQPAQRVVQERNTNHINDSKQSIVDESFKNSSARIPKGKFYVFAANYFKDFDKNGKIEPNEFVGIKKRFRKNEKFQLVLYDNRNIYGQRSLEVYSPKGEKIYERKDFKFKCDSNSTIRSIWGFYRDNHVHKDKSGAYLPIHTCKQQKNGNSPLLPFFVKKSGYGNYKAIWKIDEKARGSTEFEIIPSLKSKKTTKR